ncbi:hypothetical protein MTO96_035258 [Rhipicephalus appendiculatus]
MIYFVVGVGLLLGLSSFSVCADGLQINEPGCGMPTRGMIVNGTAAKRNQFPWMVEKPFQYGSNVRPICLPAAPMDIFDTEATVAGVTLADRLCIDMSVAATCKVGLVSFGERCAGTYIPEVFTRVETFMPWIKRVVGSFGKAYPSEVPAQLPSYTVPQWPSMYRFP